MSTISLWFLFSSPYLFHRTFYTHLKSLSDCPVTCGFWILPRLCLLAFPHSILFPCTLLSFYCKLILSKMVLHEAVSTLGCRHRYMSVFQVLLPETWKASFHWFWMNLGIFLAWHRYRDLFSAGGFSLHDPKTLDRWARVLSEALDSILGPVWIPKSAGIYLAWCPYGHFFFPYLFTRLVWSFFFISVIWESVFLNFKPGYRFKTMVSCCITNSISVCLEQEKQFSALISLHPSD